MANAHRKLANRTTTDVWGNAGGRLPGQHAAQSIRWATAAGSFRGLRPRKGTGFRQRKFESCLVNTDDATSELIPTKLIPTKLIPTKLLRPARRPRDVPS